jgi:hypothetical protein
MIRAAWGLRDDRVCDTELQCSPAMSTAFELMCLAIRLLEMRPHYRPKFGKMAVWHGHDEIVWRPTSLPATACVSEGQNTRQASVALVKVQDSATATMGVSLVQVSTENPYGVISERFYRLVAKLSVRARAPERSISRRIRR